MASMPVENTKPRIRMITPIWGDYYIDRWLDFCFASLRSEGNIPYLNEHSDFELVILTMAADAARMQADTKFNAIMAGIRIRFVTIDEFFPLTGKTSYGVPLTLAFAKGILDLGESAIGTYVILMNADLLLASGSLRSLVARIHDGYTIISATSIRVIDGPPRGMLEERIDEKTRILTIAPRDMMHLANAHLHSTVAGRIINDLSPIDSIYYHQIYWRISDDCLAMRGFLLQPLCFRIERLMEKVVCPVDYGFITELCPDGRFCVLDDTDDYFMIELQSRDSECHWLSIAPKDETLERRLARLAPEIIAHAATWTTAEHRRNATKTIYYHASDLPADLVQRVAPFEAFVDGILAAMPPPVSHLRHFQWLPAVGNYRHQMILAGAKKLPDLLDDPRNSITPTRAELLTPTAATGGTARRLIRYFAEEAMLLSARFRSLASNLAEKTLFRKPRAELAEILTTTAGAGSTARRLLRYFAKEAMLLSAGLRFLARNLAKESMLRKPRTQLAEILTPDFNSVHGKVTIAYVGNIEDHAPKPPANAKILRFVVPYVHGGVRDFRLHIPKSDYAEQDGTLVIYTPLEFLFNWESLPDDLNEILKHQRRIILVAVFMLFLLKRLDEYSWVLSVLLGFFSSLSCQVRLEVFPVEITPNVTLLLHNLTSFRFWFGLLRQSVRLILTFFRTMLSHSAQTGSPKRFSAMLIYFDRRS